MKRRDLIEIIERFTEAADAIEQNWSQGDLANAVNWLVDVRDTFAKPALEWWKSEE